MRLKLFLFIVLSGVITKLSAQLKVGEQPTVQEKSVALDVRGSNGKQGLWLPRVSDTTNSGINGLNPPNGMLIFHTPTQNVMVRRNNAWVALIASDTTVNNLYVNGTTKVTGPNVSLKVGNSPGTTNDFNLAGSTSLKEITINLPDASTTARGAVTTTAQTLGGQKTFANGVVVNNGSTLNNGTTANGGLSVTGATTSTSNLSLGLTSATTPAAQTDRYLSVNPAGNVTLNTLNTLTSVTAGGSTMTGPALTFSTGNSGTDFNISSSGNAAVWNIPDASTTARGAVTTTTQTLGGQKTFANGVVVNNGSTLNNGTTANGGLSVTGATTSTSNLTLGVTSTTTPAAQTDRYLSVNPAGNVTLNSLNAITGVTAGGTSLSGPALNFNTSTAGNDFNISSVGNTATWNLPNASPTARGAVTSTAQTFAGNKTFNDSLRVNNGSSLNNGTIANGGLTVAGSQGVNGATSRLTLGVTSATTPEGTTDKFLSVNSLGQVTLNAANIVTNNAIKIKTYFKNINNAPQNLTVGSAARYTFSFIDQNLSTTSSVVITPLFEMKLGTAILYSRVVNASTIEMVMMNHSTGGGGAQPVNAGTDGLFNITVIEF